MIAPLDERCSSLFALAAVGPPRSAAHGGHAHAQFHKSLFNELNCYFLCVVFLIPG